uniref:Uncharacterized protein n=1 Tax=Anguilla anguilla TaxID=7936 RepID=A0A0E9R9J6_ANGAN
MADHDEAEVAVGAGEPALLSAFRARANGISTVQYLNAKFFARFTFFIEPEL